jgi:hypothetical protein
MRGQHRHRHPLTNSQERQSISAYARGARLHTTLALFSLEAKTANQWMK